MNYIALTLISVLTGLATGVIGAGPEVLIIPLLGIFNILQSTKHRIGTSLFMLLPPIGLFAAIKYYKKGYVNVYAALYMSLLFAISAGISSHYGINFNHNILRKFFALFTVCIGVYYFFKDTDSKY
jgi:uncharacterized membrane protein YfcA